MTLAPGTLLNNRYRIVSILGQGGMGSVYRARDEVLNIDVAVKENLYLADEYTRQFQREASILASVRHPNMPRVGDYYSLPNQGQYLIMDYIDGEDLRQRIERLGFLPEREVILIGIMICDALTYLHTRPSPIIHRDIKPGNIKITPDGEVYLVDFGLAKISENTEQATSTGARAMTPGYSPPEQYGTARTDARSDIYSLSATLYAALTGSIPEDGLARLTGKAQLTAVRRLQPSVNRRLAYTIEKALSIDPDDRYQTSESFKTALLESGEMTHLIPPRLMVTPPPEDPNAITQIMDPNQKERSKTGGAFGANVPPPIRAKKGGRAIIWAPILFLLLVGGLLVSRSLYAASQSTGETPQNVQTAMAALTPTPPKQATATAVENNKSPSPAPQTTETALIPSPTPQEEPTIAAAGERIIFASDRSGDMQLWSMLVDGSKQQQVTTVEGGACQPDWSPDGKKIAFTSPCSSKSISYEGSKIYFMDQDGSNIQLMPVTPSPQGDFDPAWSPDGKRIAFTSLRTGVRHIFLFNLEDNSLQELSNTEFNDRQPSWGPGGKQIAFSRLEGVSKIWIMYDTGRSSFLFTLSGYVNNLSPAWSPDGQFILYSQTAANSTVPWLVSLRYEDRGTSGEKRITPKGWTTTSFPVSDVSFSPDGQWIVFESWPDGKNHDIYLMAINGDDLTRLTTDLGFDFTPAWEP